MVRYAYRRYGVSSASNACLPALPNSASVNRHPSKPQSHSASPVPALMSLNNTPVLTKLDHMWPKPATASITDETAPHTNEANSPTLLVKPSVNECHKKSSEPLSPVAGPKSTPFPSDGPRASPNPTVTLLNSDVMSHSPSPTTDTATMPHTHTRLIYQMPCTHYCPTSGTC